MPKPSGQPFLYHITPESPPQLHKEKRLRKIRFRPLRFALGVELRFALGVEVCALAQINVGDWLYLDVLPQHSQTGNTLNREDGVHSES